LRVGLASREVLRGLARSCKVLQKEVLQKEVLRGSTRRGLTRSYKKGGPAEEVLQKRRSCRRGGPAEEVLQRRSYKKGGPAEEEVLRRRSYRGGPTKKEVLQRRSYRGGDPAEEVLQRRSYNGGPTEEVLQRRSCEVHHITVFRQRSGYIKQRSVCCEILRNDPPYNRLIMTICRTDLRMRISFEGNVQFLYILVQIKDEVLLYKIVIQDCHNIKD